MKGSSLEEVGGKGSTVSLDDFIDHCRGNDLGDHRGLASAAVGWHPMSIVGDIRQEWANSWSLLELTLKKQRLRQEQLLERLTQRTANSAEDAALSDDDAEEVASLRLMARKRMAPPSHRHIELEVGVNDDPGSTRDLQGTTQDFSDTSGQVLEHGLSEGSAGAPGQSKARRDDFMSSANSTRYFQVHRNCSLEMCDLMDDLKARKAKQEDGDGFRSKLKWEVFLLQVLEGVECALHNREPARSGIFARVLGASAWKVLVSFVIAVNSVFMIFQADFAVTSYIDGSGPPPVMKTLELAFIAFFMVELVLKLIVHRFYFFCGNDMQWNVFDFCLVVLSIYDIALSFDKDGGGGNFTFFRSLRILRITRTLRVIRLLKFAGQLRRMLLSILGSISSLVWSFAVLFFVFYIFGLLTVQSVTASLPDLPQLVPADEVESVQAELLEHFGSVGSAMLTYYMATSGGNDWSLYYGLLRKLSAFDSAVLIFVIGFTQMALFNVLTGIFVENAMKIAVPDSDALALERRREAAKEAASIRSFLVNKVDTDRSGSISEDEFKEMLDNPRAMSMLAVMGLELKDARTFLDMVAEGAENNDDAEVSIDQFVDACMAMKGTASKVDLHTLMYKVDQLSGRVQDFTSRVAAAPGRPRPSECGSRA